MLQWPFACFHWSCEEIFYYLSVCLLKIASNWQIKGIQNLLSCLIALMDLKHEAEKIPSLAQAVFSFIAQFCGDLFWYNCLLFQGKQQLWSLKYKTAVKVGRKSCQILSLTVEIVVSSSGIKLQVKKAGSAKHHCHLVSHDSLIITWVPVIGKKHN